MNNRNSYSSTTAPFNNNNNGNNNQVAPRNKKTDINTNRNADTELLSQHGNYVLPHVGNKNYGDADLEYIKRQRSILDKNASKVPSSFDPPYNDMYTPVMGLIGERNTYVKPLPEKSDRYDAFGDFLYSKGLMDRDNVTRYITHYINIDSSERQTAPFAEVGWRQLQTDSLKMEKGK